MAIQVSILKQSIPSLILSLITLAFVGTELTSANKNDIFTVYPLILVSTCILSFKGNLEMCYGLYLRYNDFRLLDFIIVLIQSACIGTCVGLLGAAGSALRGVEDIFFLFKLVINCMYSCIISTALIQILILIVIIGFKNVFNPDNIILPLISCISEYLSVISLVFFLINLDLLFIIFSITFLLILVSYGIFLIINRSDKLLFLEDFQKLPDINDENILKDVQNDRIKQALSEKPIYLLVIVYTMSTLSGMLIEYYSKKHPYMISSAPVFCGLTGSISYIYLNRRLSNIYETTQHNKFNTAYTLTIVSLILSFLYIFLSFFLISYSLMFSIFFIIFFVLDVILLIEIIEILIRYLVSRKIEIGSIMIPLLTSIADFIGCFCLIIMVTITV
ncbi:hypothetical protein DMUE_2214 [Dictyocoela muelleri]|nr:hypothetical protein DMUE_2214 [Dictyocoela muelleri]